MTIYPILEMIKRIHNRKHWVYKTQPRYTLWDYIACILIVILTGLMLTK